MGSGCIDFIRGMYMPGSGVMGRAMGAGCILVRMEAGMSGSSSGESSMGLDITISGKTLDLLFFCKVLLSSLVSLWLAITAFGCFRK